MCFDYMSVCTHIIYTHTHVWSQRSAGWWIPRSVIFSTRGSQARSIGQWVDYGQITEWKRDHVRIRADQFVGIEGLYGLIGGLDKVWSRTLLVRSDAVEWSWCWGLYISLWRDEYYTNLLEQVFKLSVTTLQSPPSTRKQLDMIWKKTNFLLY